jgi:hypothetical protein
MTKKDYVATIAVVTDAYMESLAEYPIMKGYVNLNPLMYGFIHMFEADNPRFDKNRFIIEWQKYILPLNK